MKQFFIENWRWILEAVCAVAALVFCLIRKKPVKVVDTLQQIILRLLPGLINQAEIQFGCGNGSAKLQFVLDLLQSVLKQMGYGGETIQSYLRFAKDQVEVILSTPQKKG